MREVSQSMKLIEEVTKRLNSKMNEVIADICKEYSLQPKDIILESVDDTLPDTPTEKGVIKKYNVRLKSTGVTITKVSINLKYNFII